MLLCPCMTFVAEFGFRNWIPYYQVRWVPCENRCFVTSERNLHTQPPTQCDTMANSLCRLVQIIKSRLPDRSCRCQMRLYGRFWWLEACFYAHPWCLLQKYFVAEIFCCRNLLLQKFFCCRKNFTDRLRTRWLSFGKLEGSYGWIGKFGHLGLMNNLYACEQSQ